MRFRALDAAQHGVVRCRAGADVSHVVLCLFLGPGSAQQRYTLQRVRDTSTGYRPARVQVSPPQSAPTQPSTRSESADVTVMLLA